jgi:urease accessory protein
VGHAQLALLHLCDSLFPVGSFAHSDGLESAVVSGHVTSAADLRDWVRTTLTISLGAFEGPAVREAFDAMQHCDAGRLSTLDDEMRAMRPSAAGREATLTMGTRLLKTWVRLRPSVGLQQILGTRERFTFPVAFGMVCAAADVDGTSALEAYFYTRLAAIISAAMRLMSIGQHEAHALLAETLADVPALAADVRASRSKPVSFVPMMDVETMSHQYVHSRLFRS